MKIIPTICFSSFLLLSNQLSNGVDAFAISSSSTPSKKLLTNKGKSGGGFGKAAQNSVPPQHTPDTSKEIQDLIQFLNSQNAKGLKPNKAGCEVGISTSTSARGVYATKPFKKNDIIFKIPSDLALALSNPDLGGKDAPTMAHCGRNFIDMYQDNPVASKNWAPYLNTLPADKNSPYFDATPDFFSDEEIDGLEFPLAMNQAKERLMEIAELCAKDEIDFDQLQFATWLVSSRSVPISMDDTSLPMPDSEDSTGTGAVVSKPSKTIRVMVPFLDMINHSSDNANAEIHLIDPEKDEAWFAIRATRSIKAGRELTISYGTGVDTSIGLLLNYGFVPDSNRVDAFMLKRDLDEKDYIKSLDGWSTTLEDDEKKLEDPNLSDNEKKVLQFRCQLKKSYP